MLYMLFLQFLFYLLFYYISSIKFLLAPIILEIDYYLFLFDFSYLNCQRASL
jgi:hypothetical protein